MLRGRKGEPSRYCGGGNERIGNSYLSEKKIVRWRIATCKVPAQYDADKSGHYQQTSVLTYKPT